MSGKSREISPMGNISDETLTALYGHDGVKGARQRIAHVLGGFEETFGRPAEAMFSAPGRTEIGGNHTDHQHGLVLAAAVNLDILAAVRVTGSGFINVLSEGYGLFRADLSELRPDPREFHTAQALVRGVAAGFERSGSGYAGAGLDIYAVSSVPGGSGLSSSAAFEVLIGTMINEMLCSGCYTPADIARIGQYAENVFFGKPSGLMDQTASSVGGVIMIDFADADHPEITHTDFDPAHFGHSLCILESGADHAGLADEYEAITAELASVSGYFARKVLREVPEEDFLSHIDALRASCGDRAVLRALHVYEENKRVILEAEALGSGDFGRFLGLIGESGHSSIAYLQNVIPAGNRLNQDLMLTIALAGRLLGGRGAVRVHGGGFAGTAEAFVPEDMLPEFKHTMESVIGEGHCHIVTLRHAGSVRLA